MLKITNPNTSLSETPVFNSNGSVWTQVYVEIPAKLYMDKGWLDEDLHNLRFIDEDSGSIELAHWVPPKADGNLHINHLGLWLLVKDLDAGETEMIRMEMVDGASFYANPRAMSVCGGSGTDPCTVLDKTEYNAAATIMPFYGYNSGDWKWDKTDPAHPYAANVRFLNKALYSEDDLAGDGKWSEPVALTTNEFTISLFNLKYYSVANSGLSFYFLSQATSAADLPTEPGYRLLFDDYTRSTSDDMHYTRARFTIKIQEYNGSTWGTKASTFWQPYGNSRFIFDLKVSSSQIFVTFNGRQYNFTPEGPGTVTDGKYNRTDSLLTGHFGYDRDNWRRCCGSDLNYFMLRRFLDIEPEYEVYGNADLVITDTSSSTSLGEDMNEISPDLQQFNTTINGNSFDDYIFSTYSIARPEQIVDDFEITLRNRSALSETFHWNVQNTNSSGWIAYFCDNSGNNCAPTAPVSDTLSGGSSKTYRIKLVPTPSALVNGLGSDLTVEVTAVGDASFDNIRLKTSSLSNLGCFWEYKAKQVITWNGGHGYSDLKDYQVLVSITGEPDLQYAQPNGTDIVITDANNSIVDFWLKSFDPVTGSLQAWVKVPSIDDGGATTDLYVWWGNANYGTSRSNKFETFDLWEDWENDYVQHQRIGCDDGTRNSTVHGNRVNDGTLIGYSCENQPLDAHGWEGVPTPDDNYNWWELDIIGSETLMQADISSSHKSADKGPFIHKGGLGWDHYEVSYTFYTGTYDQYNPSTGRANPEYNPVFFNDAGNMWGMEYFANKFIFRPYGAGIDFTWQYQTNVKNLTGEIFPKRDSWYSAKVRIYKDKVTGDSYLKLFVSQPKVDPNNLPDVDSELPRDYTQIAEFAAPPAFTLEYGGIGFGGWDSGFGFDDIRVRKYAEDNSGDAPVVVHDSVTVNPLRDALTLSTPQITAPIFGGRSAYIDANAIPFAWRGDMLAYYADCYINGECDHSQCTACGGTENCPGISAAQCAEDSTKLGSISVFGKIDDTTPKGAGYGLMARDPGENNPGTPLTENRTIYTSDGSNNLVDFEIDNCLTLQPDLLTVGTCDPSDGLLDETEKMIRFVRGYYVGDPQFPRSTSRNFDNKAGYGNNDGIADPNEQWKIGDVLHSSPLLIGIPNMAYGTSDYWETFVDNNDDRPLVAYFMSNDGVLHAVQLASVDANGNYQPDPTARELWGFIPHAVLPKLKDSRDSDHEYLADGLLRAIDIKVAGVWKTVLFGIGGKGNIYAFGMDVTDPTNPILLWEMNGDPTNRIGTTISSPALGQVDTDGNGTPDTWVAIIGSGYDLDYLNNYENKKAWLTMFNLNDGTILKQLKVSDKTGNVTGHLAVLRDAQSGEITKLYMGDYYGCLWRITGERLGRTDGAAPLPNGAMLDDDDTDGITDLLFKPADYLTTTQPYQPDNPIVVQPRIAKGEGTNEFWVYFGSGDYNEYTATYPNQYFYGLRDKTSTYETGDADLLNVTLSTATNGSNQSWYIQLGNIDGSDYINDTTTGELAVKNSNERVIKTAEVYGGFVFFTTFQPVNTPCGGGKSRFYAVNYRTGLMKDSLFLGLTSGGNTITSVRSVELQTGGIPSQPMIMEGQSGNGTAVATGVTTSSSGGIEKIELDPSLLSTALSILLWREQR
jgi:hypothetical protein